MFGPARLRRTIPRGSADRALDLRRAAPRVSPYARLAFSECQVAVQVARHPRAMCSEKLTLLVGFLPRVAPVAGVLKRYEVSTMARSPAINQLPQRRH